MHLQSSLAQSESAAVDVRNTEWQQVDYQMQELANSHKRMHQELEASIHEVQTMVNLAERDRVAAGAHVGGRLWPTNLSPNLVFEILMIF